MFTHSIDDKPHIIDDKGNEIVNLAASMFKENAAQIQTYTVKRMSSFFEMRPDLVSNTEYRTPKNTEFILKYSGISNPFSLKDDDILMIPNETEAEARTSDLGTVNDRKTAETQIRNIFKFANQDYKKDSTPYDNLKKKEIKSGVQNDLESGDYIVPYISEDGTTAVTIRNGRMYFGEDSGLATANIIKASTTNLDKKIQEVIDNTGTALSDANCQYNGLTMAQFIRANIIKNFT